ncbi:hypothetical protein HYPSUDRAFT_857569 [Hypholoma sublateritium FD-334 SS-4]|uniref:Uncharacterized protein n=1 Tax=Hypholoma sublateritium (strain FD-334 SS-4) TaxID=945553 RepID=A0A0D2KYE3_HYPSF|nr:hypothetical protein HYPSUDRAFT_857569 [Hypholoma sublateritium FD-334 SS-4]
MIPLRSVVRAALIGPILNWVILGTLALQAYNLSQSFPRESLVVKIYVYTLLTISTLQSVVATNFARRILVSRWGDPTVSDRDDWSSIAVPVIAGVALKLNSSIVFAVLNRRRRAPSLNLPSEGISTTYGGTDTSHAHYSPDTDREKTVMGGEEGVDGGSL